MLFNKDIHDWTSWGAVFQDMEAFSPLALDILDEAGFPALPLQHLTPGTNAVFRSGDAVIKLYFPPESGLDSRYDWETERAVMERAAAFGVPAPRLLAAGERQDKYLFRWIIMEFCAGKEAGDAIAGMDKAQRRDFARQVRELLQKLDQPAEGLIAPKDLKSQAVHNKRLLALHPALAQELRGLASSLDLTDSVLVHGDCTGENLLVGEEGKPILIDFADCALAPAWYELPPVVFELFRCDQEMVRAFMDGENEAAFLEKLFCGLALHDFGGDFVKIFFQREGIAPDEILSLRPLKLLLRNRLFENARISESFPSVNFPGRTGELQTDIENLYRHNNRPDILSHVCAVADTAAVLAEQFGLDRERCRLAAMLHDIAGILPPGDMLERAREWGAELDPAECRYPFLLHQRFSALLAREWLGVRDPLILSAIRCHTTLKAHAAKEDIVLFLADKLSWDQEGEPPFRGMLTEKLKVSLESAALAYLDYVVGEGKLLLPHRWLTEAHQWLPASFGGI